MDLSLMNTRELYGYLKKNAPNAAVGLTRARRETLEGTLMTYFPGYKELPQPKQGKLNVQTGEPRKIAIKLDKHSDLMAGKPVVVKAEDFDGVVAQTIPATLKQDAGSLKIGVAKPKRAHKGRGHQAAFPNKPILPFVLSAVQKDSLKKMFDDVDVVAKLWKHLGLTSEKIAGLVGLAAGTDPETVVKVLDAALRLGDIFAPNRHHHAVDAKGQAA